MSGGAVYRVGRSDVFLPGDLAADAETLDGQVNALDSALDGNEQAPSDWWDQWNAFVADWRGFKKRTFGGFFANLGAALNDSNRDQLVAYETRFDTWASEAKGYGAGLPAGARTEVSMGSGDSLNNQLSNLGLPSVGGLIGLVLVSVAGLFVWRFVK